MEAHAACSLTGDLLECAALVQVAQSFHGEYQTPFFLITWLQTLEFGGKLIKPWEPEELQDRLTN